MDVFGRVYMPISPTNSTRPVVQQRQATVHKLTLIERDIDVYIYVHSIWGQ